MKFFTITKWEFKNTLSSRKFVMIFFMQLSVLILMMIFFNMFTASIESEKDITLSPSLTGFASIDVSDNSGLFTKQLNHEILDINTLNPDESLYNVKNGKITAALIIPESKANIDNFQAITANIYVNYEDPKRNVVLEEVNLTTKAISGAISNKWINSLVPEESIEPEIKEEKKGESLPLQLIRKMMIAVLLFLPLFLFGNMVVDSIVGEKERKTAEILVTMPMGHGEIIIGKSLAVILTIAIQIALWMIIVLIAGIDIKNPFIVYMLIVLTSVPIIGITSVIASYSKNYKEAGIGLSFIYIIIVGFLIVPTLAYISSKSVISNISPMTIVMRLFSGETISINDFMIPIISIIVISLISYWISIKLFKRDDITFGPRPGIVKIVLDLVDKSIFGRH